MTEQTACVVGAGLVGTLAAAMLAKRGWTVTLIESRSDPRKAAPSERARSINLALSPRGIEALRSVSEALAERVIKEGIKMRGRMLHTTKNGTTVRQGQDYGFPAEGEFIRSISRGALGIYLLDHVDTLPSEGRGSVTTRFDTKLVDMDMRREKGVQITFGSREKGEEKQVFDFVIGGDGAYSRVRREMMRGSKTRFVFRPSSFSYSADHSALHQFQLRAEVRSSRLLGTIDPCWARLDLLHRAGLPPHLASRRIHAHRPRQSGQSLAVQLCCCS